MEGRETCRRNGGAMDRQWIVYLQLLLMLMLVTAVPMAAEVSIRQLSPCRAVINDFVYNLQPLMRIDGHPRFEVEDDSGRWNYSFNPCMSFNLPSDPHEGEGDQCHYVAVCLWRRTATAGEYFSLGLQKSARFVLQRRPITKTIHDGFSSTERGRGSSSGSSSEDNSFHDGTNSRLAPNRTKDLANTTVEDTPSTTTKDLSNIAAIDLPSTGVPPSTDVIDLPPSTRVTRQFSRIVSQSSLRESDRELAQEAADNPSLGKNTATVSLNTPSVVRKVASSDSSESFADSSKALKNHSNITQAKGDNRESLKHLKLDEGSRDNESGKTSANEGRNPEGNGEIEETSGGSHQKRIPALLFRGIRTKLRRKVFVYLICDYNRTTADDAWLRKIEDSSQDKYFELHHRCCCPDGCVENSPHDDSAGGARAYLHQSAQNIAYSYDTWRSESMLEQPAAETKHPSESGYADSGGSLDKRPKYIWLVLVINAAILVIAVLVAGLCCRKGGMSFVSSGSYGYVPTAMHSSRLTMDSTDLDSRYLSTGKPSSPDYRDYGSSTQISKAPVLDNCVIPGHQIDVGQRLGGGLFSDTYLAEWKMRLVAVKRIAVRVHQNQLTDADSAWITNEIYRLSRQRHWNLVAVLGICIDTRQPYVINELIEGDSLKEKIVSMEIEQYSWHQRTKLCLQVADGMAFLHSAKNPVLHRDLRCANILIDQYGKAKIVDYGLTRIVQRFRSECDHGAGCYCQKEHSALPASVRWTAPEIVGNPTAEESDTSVFSTACDVYSFAMMCWEIASYKDPFDESTEEQVIDMVLQGIRPPVNSLITTIAPFRELMKACWNQNPEARPTFKQIAVTLKSIQQIGGRFSSQSKRKRTNSESTNYLRSALNVSEI